MKPRLLDVVELLEPQPRAGLAAGRLGTIVEELTHPHEAYEVEFCDEDGRTVAQLALRPTQFAIAIAFARDEE
ncbi:MAG TPA: DUF4926 domain-containing protein [Xanthomonadales bacterium]|nr:DUF4926 domain-containing protein [Xanthomonadales bacterium]